MITTEHVPGTPCWLDLGVPDVERAADFYHSVFGWEPESSGSEEYMLFRLHGKVVAAIGKLTEQGARSAWMVYFNTPDADATTAAVQRLGGTVRVQPMGPVGDGGRMAQFSDPQGAQFAIFEAGADRGLQLVDDPGGLMWLELYTTDAAAAKEFYGTLFNWEYEDMPLPGGGGTYSMIGPTGQGQERMLGGLMELDPADLPGGRPYWHPVFHVENCDTVVNSVTGHGGSVQMGPEDATGVGRIAVCSDQSNAEFVVLTPSPV